MAQRPHAQAVPSSPMIDTTTGEVDTAWRAFLVGLYNRTGGANGQVAASAADLAAEKATRIANDAAMAASIAALTAGGASSGASFDAQLAAEQAQRRAADAALQAYIDARLPLHGVTDGSDAAPGMVGEYLSAASGTVALTSAITANVVSLALPAGDWDVSGDVAFTAGSGTHDAFGAGVTNIDTFITATYPATAINEQLNTASRRASSAATATVWLVAVAFFAGTVTVTGTIRARRVR